MDLTQQTKKWIANMYFDGDTDRADNAIREAADTAAEVGYCCCVCGSSGEVAPNGDYGKAENGGPCYWCLTQD